VESNEFVVAAGKASSRRMRLLEELSKFIPIDRIGRCATNVDPAEVGMPPQNRDSKPLGSKSVALRRFKFPRFFSLKRCAKKKSWKEFPQNREFARQRIVKNPTFLAPLVKTILALSVTPSTPP